MKSSAAHGIRQVYTESQVHPCRYLALPVPDLSTVNATDRATHLSFLLGVSMQPRTFSHELHEL